MASTKPVDVTVKKIQLGEIKNALEILDNPNSGTDDTGKEKPRRYKFKDVSKTRYDLAMNYRHVVEHWRIVDKVRRDIVRLQMDEQVKTLPEINDLTGRWNQAAAKEIESMWTEDVTLSLRQIPLASIDLETNATIPFTAIAILIGNVIVDSEDDTKDED